VIQSFQSVATEDFFYEGKIPRKAGWRGISRIVMRKLEMVDAAEVLDDLRVPPGNRLEKLRGDLSDFHSIRVNEQWRVIFIWHDGAPEEVEVVDYH
jgi:proteic killer suppression protein